ncbi:hypothetical protein V6N13_007979 [Hibiscus sabdariffa]|uniref:Uncharacterized protein n=1 Tax=Hibiscus sabdariffa TaxID=183260 RepID=A0ABR2EDQ2_9ROSI
MVGMVDRVVDERCVGMESTLCVIGVTHGEGMMHEVVNEGLVIEARVEAMWIANVSLGYEEFELIYKPQGDVGNEMVGQNSNALVPCNIDTDFGLNSLNWDCVEEIHVEEVDNVMVSYIETNFVVSRDVHHKVRSVNAIVGT